jgi:heterodisulfide reductase subunit A
VKVEPIVSELYDEEACRGCGMCAANCPYGAIEIVETPKGPKAKFIDVACKGCGVCAATCYKRAIAMSHYTDEQLNSQVEAYLKGEGAPAQPGGVTRPSCSRPDRRRMSEFRPKILAFCCNW